MPRLWTPLLLRESRGGLKPGASPVTRPFFFAEWGLCAAQALFLWMFLAADPLEQLAERNQLAPASTTTREDAFRFAADWRHGMAGNSPLYLPGFFLLALATWLADRSRLSLRVATILFLLALFAARLVGPFAGDSIVHRFAQESGAQAIGALASPRWTTAVVAGYTLLTWSVFIIGLRRAIISRSYRLLLATAPMTLVLAAIRPWTVGDFSSIWASRVASGNAAAIGSLIAWALLIVCLILSDRKGRFVLSSSRPDYRQRLPDERHVVPSNDQNQCADDHRDVEAGRVAREEPGHHEQR